METMTRAEAMAAGLTRYFNGSPCPSGHAGERFCSSGACCDCAAVNVKRRRKTAIKKPRRKPLGPSPESVLRARNKYREKNRDAVNARAKSWRIANAERVTAYAVNYQRERLKVDPTFALAKRMRGLLRMALIKKGYRKKSKTALILGCTMDFFRLHIERQFLPNMSWADASAWHLDHIVPLATAKTEDDVLRLNHFTNLRPLWSVDNIKKSGQVTHLL